MNDNKNCDNLFEGLETVLFGEKQDLSTLQLPDPELLTYYKHLSERRFWVDFSVDEYVLEVVRNIMLWNIEDSGKPRDQVRPIWLYLFNYGGSADIMWMLIDTILKSETPVYTVDMGKCGSAAALIFMAGHKRFMMPSATVLIHEGSNDIGGDAVKVIDQAESYKAMIKRMRNYIISRTNIPQATLTRKKNNDWELDTEACMKYGVCDHVVQTLSDIC